MFWTLELNMKNYTAGMNVFDLLTFQLLTFSGIEEIEE